MMVSTAGISQGLCEAHRALGPDLEFVLEGIEGLIPSRAFTVLDGLRIHWKWDDVVHLELAEFVIDQHERRRAMN